MEMSTTGRPITIGGFNQRQGDRGIASPNIFDFEVCGLHCIENYRNCCHLMSDFKAKKAPNSISAGTPLGELAALLQTPS